MRFVAYDDAASTPNVVVDGSGNAGTVLTLSHWPGIAQPPGIGADLSAEMAFAYLDAPAGHPALDHPPVSSVTNNHFDQDGLVGVFALVDPAAALAHREVLIDVAAAGDFGTYRHRAAARASMAIWAYADDAASPLADELAGLEYPAQCRVLYERTLPLLVPMVTEPERFRSLWADEDEALTSSERAIRDGDVRIREDRALDLAEVTIALDEPSRSGHRFAHERFGGVHPMALGNATGCFRLLLVHGWRYRYADRYETWVQYRSRRPLPRVDLRPLAEQLTASESGTTTWRADAPSALAPELTHDGESSLPARTVADAVERHLRTAAPAWDPYTADDP